ncbi:hypothetical protein BX661DRAFT_184367 [Kickxella alabastrina]|uniref:uncharacterized protein n=1 Tax=Kickxella alabastrina TaxID=61397 RepID=UPI0022211BFD|nr:uncharacterized protein BX661DRAFT_184367 [Kickxella alabastrina]KAI7825903.1 hypothetical protein BX661DRAFT_184367 [Kickxella alabastrina]
MTNFLTHFLYMKPLAVTVTLVAAALAREGVYQAEPIYAASVPDGVNLAPASSNKIPAPVPAHPIIGPTSASRVTNIAVEPVCAALVIAPVPATPAFASIYNWHTPTPLLDRQVHDLEPLFVAHVYLPVPTLKTLLLPLSPGYAAATIGSIFKDTTPGPTSEYAAIVHVPMPAHIPDSGYLACY